MANTARNTPGVEKITVEDSNPLVNVQSKYEQNKKPINTIITVALAVIVGFFAYKKLYQEPRENKAATQMSFAQRYFETDSVSKGLEGDGQHPGFLKIIKKYSGTKAANLSEFYAGISYLRMGDFKNAIKHLEEFDGEGSFLTYAAWGALGDAHMEIGNTKKGIEYYLKASSDKENIAFTPMYLQRAAIAFEMENKPDDAIKAYVRIRDEYPQSAQARDVEKSLARLGVLN